MAFVVVQTGIYSWKVHDPDRRIELKSLHGTSEDLRFMRLVGDFDEADIIGSRYIRELDGSDGYRNLITWEVQSDDRSFRYGSGERDVADLRILLKEAFALYGFGGHIRPGDRVKVLFEL